MVGAQVQRPQVGGHCPVERKQNNRYVRMNETRRISYIQTTDEIFTQYESNQNGEFRKVKVWN
jgi:hypothetical protein